MNPPFDPQQAAAGFPVELLRYSTVQLSDALAMRFVAEGQELTQIMRQVETLVQVVEAADPEFTLYPKGPQLQAQRKDLFDEAAKLLALGRAYTTTVATVKANAVELRTRFTEYFVAVQAAARPNGDTSRG